MVPVVLAGCAILTMAVSEKSIERVGTGLLNTGHEAREWLHAKLYLLSARNRARGDERRARPYQSTLSSNWAAGRLACRCDRPTAVRRVAPCKRSSYAAHCSVRAERALSCTQQGRTLARTSAYGVVSYRSEAATVCMAVPASRACSRAGHSCHRCTAHANGRPTVWRGHRVPHPVIRKRIFITRALSGEKKMTGKGAYHIW